MKINGLVVCVNYSDYLEIGLNRWYNYLDSLTVVTNRTDENTFRLIQRYPGVNLFSTNAFYEGGAVFNKGRAMENARHIMPWKDWILFFDADVVPEIGWFQKIPHSQDDCLLDKCKLYGADRYQASSSIPIDDDAFDHLDRIPDGPCDGGYFHLFHSSIKAQDEPLLETCWPHAGVYDSMFRMRFLPKDQVVLPIRLSHMGPRENWCGRGNDEAMKKLLSERQRLGGYYHERMEVK